MTPTDIPGEIARRLEASLAPVEIAVVDDSAQHAGHAGAASGGGHYNLRVVSARFTGLSRVARHRLVYDSLSDLMRSAIHALAIEALTLDEAGCSSTSAPAAGPAGPP
jgi:BolA protein